jgi:exodeoxyribonuclease VII small subunit
MSNTEKNNYTDSIKELERILAELEQNDATDMDTITIKVKRASQLLSICKNRLTQINSEIEKLMSELD